jgi:hypothetical protein
MPRWATAFKFVIPPAPACLGPERTRISYIAVPHEVTYAVFRKESRTKFANATNLDGKSGVV